MMPIDRLRAAIKNRPAKSEWGWSAGSQSEALAYYLSAGRVWRTYSTGGWQGDQAALIEFGGDWFLWRDGYGSCSGCDALEGRDGFAYILGTITPGNVHAFMSKAEAVAWLKSPPTDGHWDDWRELREGLLGAIGNEDGEVK